MKFGILNIGRNMPTTRFYHEPVLVGEVLAGLQVAFGKRYIDATIGGGGHTKEIVKRGGIVLGIDTDGDAVDENKGMQWKVVQGNFRNIEQIACENGFEHPDGILFDLGVSSHQLDTKERGFSYRFADAPIDMRLDQAQEKSAKDYLRVATEEELYEIIATYGEEERARAIAHALVRARSITPIQTVGDVIGIIGEQNKVLSRVFQALRIVVNDELQALKEALIGSHHLLKPGGRLAVISFHSLEDRIVKREMSRPIWLPITKKPIVAEDREMRANKRSRSAKLRIAEKL